MAAQPKLGVRTSLQDVEGVRGRSTASPKREIISQYSNQTHSVGLNRQEKMTVEDLNTAKFAQSSGQAAQKQDFHFSYGQGKGSNYLPPPPEQFMVGSNHLTYTYSQPSQLPINSGSTYTVQTIHPLQQSIRRQHVPLHIYNQIPFVPSQTKRYEQSEQIEEQGINEADQQILVQYEKLYGIYMQEKKRSEMLERQLKQYEIREQHPGTQIREIIHTKEVQRPKKIDAKVLASLLITKNKAVIDEIVERRKRVCINKLKDLFVEQEASIKTTLIRSSDEFVRVTIH